MLKRILKHKVLRTFGIYSGFGMLNRMVPFILMPVMTRYLSPAEYGILAVYNTLLSFTVPFIGMSMENNITRVFYRESKNNIAKLMSNILIVVGVAAIICIVVSLLGLRFVVGFSGLPVFWVFSIPIVAAMNMVNQFNLTIIRNNHKALLFGIFESSNMLIQIVVSVLLVVYYRKGWEGNGYAVVIAAVVFFVVGFMHLRLTGFLKFNIDLERIKEILKISLPMIPYALGGTIIFLSDRFFIDHMVSKSAVGIYVVGYSFGMIVTIFKDAFTKAWSPWIFKHLSHITEEGRIKIVRITYIYMASILILALVTTFGSYILLKFMVNERYHSAKEFIIWVALANAINGMYSVVMPYSVQLGRTRILGGIMLFAGVVNLVGNYFLIKMNGPLGAAQATLIAYCFSFLITWWYVQRIYPMPWFSKSIFFKRRY